MEPKKEPLTIEVSESEVENATSTEHGSSGAVE
jgi:hypothetical protein